ncbi:MAG: tetratricopeptide repeat protein [Verrucomicrobia bacterium]|nr:tetratricopeptide repeat protein [Verrucomicrobiota bacterium]
MVQHGDIEDAIREFVLIMADSPDNVEYHLHLARMHSWAQKYELAIDLYRKYLEMDIDAPAREQATFELAAVLAWSGQPGASARMLMEMVEKKSTEFIGP